MPNYQNSKIYQIRSHQTDKVYVGSTTQSLSKRLAKHRCNYKRYQNGKGYSITSFEILQYPDAYIELLESVICENKEQLLIREGHYIRTLDCVNRYVAGRTTAEWRAENSDKIKLRDKKYKADNKQKLKQYRESQRGKHMCYECDIPFSEKSALNRHLKTDRHKKKYNAMYKECFSDSD